MAQPLNLTALEADVKKAVSFLTQAKTLLDKWSVPLTEEQRKKALRPPTTFFTKGPTFLRSVIAHPQLSAGTGKDPKAVLDYLEAISVIAPANELASHVASQLDDTRTAWVGSVYGPSLEFYGVAKVIAKSNPDIEPVVKDLAGVFSGGHHTKKPDDPPTDGSESK